MIKNRILSILVICFLALSACQQNETVLLTATMSELTGLVEFKKAGADAFSPATPDSTMQVDDQLQTGDDGRVRLDLSSGTIIRVAPSSSFTLLSNEPTDGGLVTKLKLELGKIFIILNGGSMDVDTPSGVASVRGSYMKVEVDEETGDVYVTCLEGHCSATNPAGGVEFTEGERTILFHQDDNGNWQVPGVEEMTPEDFQEWLDNNPEAKELFNQAMGTATALAASRPTATPIPPTATPEPTIVSSVPAGGSSSVSCNASGPTGRQDHQGRVNFEWADQPGATRYVLTIKDSSGKTVTFETTETSYNIYVETYIPSPGNYEWYVTGYGEGDTVLCESEPVTFDKPDSEYIPPPPPEEEPSCDPEDICCIDPEYCQSE